MLVRATWPFFMVRGGHIYEVGEIYDATDAEAERLVSRGLAEVVTPGGAESDTVWGGGADGTSGLTVAELKALCDERGVDYTRKATKAQLLSLLAE